MLSGPVSYLKRSIVWSDCWLPSWPIHTSFSWLLENKFRSNFVLDIYYLVIFQECHIAFAWSWGGIQELPCTYHRWSRDITSPEMGLLWGNHHQLWSWVHVIHSGLGRWGSYRESSVLQGTKITGQPRIEITRPPAIVMLLVNQLINQLVNE